MKILFSAMFVILYTLIVVLILLTSKLVPLACVHIYKIKHNRARSPSDVMFLGGIRILNG